MSGYCRRRSRDRALVVEVEGARSHIVGSCRPGDRRPMGSTSELKRTRELANAQSTRVRDLEEQLAWRERQVEALRAPSGEVGPQNRPAPDSPDPTPPLKGARLTRVSRVLKRKSVPPRKTNTSLSLSVDLLARLDALCPEYNFGSRSALVEHLLRAALDEHDREDIAAAQSAASPPCPALPGTEPESTA